jgi:hypothetical protein
MIKRKAKRISRPIHKLTKPITQQGFGHEMPPCRALVNIYFEQKGMLDEGDIFYKFYDKAKWRSPKGTAYGNWKVLAARWIANSINS